MIRAIPAAGIPMASRTTISMMRPAPGTPADPTAAKVEVNTIITCWPKVSSIPRAWAINTAATLWYRLVPFMLTVAPRGRTKLEMFSDTPSSSSVIFMVTGSVALLELVEKASNCAGRIALKKWPTGTFVINLSKSGNMTIMTIKRPANTIKLYLSKAKSSVRAESGSSPAISTIKEAIKANTP